MSIFSIFGKKRKTKGFFVNSYGNDKTRGLYTFHIDIDNGELLYKKYFKTPSDPIYSFNYGRFTCVTYKNSSGTIADGGVCSYAARAESLGLASRVSNKGKTYIHACTNGDDETATRLFCVDYYNGEVVVANFVKRKLVKFLSTYKLEGHGVNPEKQSLPYPTYVGLTPDQQRLYVVALGLDKVLMFKIEENGSLIMDEEHTLELTPGSGPKKMIFNDEGTYAYVLNELANTICVYRYQDLQFELVQTVDTYPKDEEELTSYAGQMKITPDGKHMYVTNRGHDSLVLFNILEDGTLQYMDFADTSPNPTDIAFFENKWIVVCCQKGGILESYQYVPEKGGMIFETKYSYLVNEPVCITPFKTSY